MANLRSIDVPCIISEIPKDTLLSHFLTCWAFSFDYADAIFYRPATLRAFSRRHFDVAMDMFDYNYETYVMLTNREFWRKCNQRRGD